MALKIWEVRMFDLLHFSGFLMFLNSLNFFQMRFAP